MNNNQKQVLNFVQSYAKAAKNSRKHRTTIERKHCFDNESFAVVNSLTKLNKKDGPALLIAAGPSFRKHIDTIRRLNGIATTFAASRAYPELLENLITPDYVFHLDSHSHERWFAKTSHNTKLLVPLTVNPDIKEYWPDNLYFFRNEESNTIKKRKHGRERAVGGELPFIECGGHVGAAMIYAASQYFGHNPIALIGYDYAASAGQGFYGTDEAKKGKYYSFVSSRGEHVKTSREYFTLALLALGTAISSKETTWYSPSEGIFGLMPLAESNTYEYNKRINYVTMEKFYDILKTSEASL